MLVCGLGLWVRGMVNGCECESDGCGYGCCPRRSEGVKVRVQFYPSRRRTPGDGVCHLDGPRNAL